MSVTARLIAGSLLVLVGLALLVVAGLQARGALPRNRWAGIRTPATLRSDTQFIAGNRAAAVPVGAAGLIALVGGAVLLVGGSAALEGVVLAVSVLGLVGLTVVGGVVGDRAAALTPAPTPFAATCAGTCAGCDLVAGCRGEPSHTPPQTRTDT